MVEYDALPGIGHGCGHNLHGPLSVLAGIVLSELPEDAFHGTLEVIGTPAEETVGAKLIFAKEGVFDGDALAIMMHSTSGGISRTNTQANALRAYEITFTGKTAHAAGDPWDGHNALTALRKFLDLVDARRDSFHPFTIASGIITEGGKAPNVVPDRAALRFEFRYPVKREIERLDRIVKNCAKGAALALDCSVEFTLAGPDFDDMVRVPLLEEKIKELFTSYGEPVGDPLPPGGSTDAGNVSYRCPTLHAYISISDKACPGHSTALRDATITPHALDQMAKGAAVIAEMVLTVFNDAGYRVAVQKNLSNPLQERKDDRCLKKRKNPRSEKFPVGPAPCFVLLFGIIVFAAIMTWILPAGDFNRVTNSAGQKIVQAGTYHLVKAHPVSFFEMFKCIYLGMKDAAPVILFLFIAYGFIGLIIGSGAFDGLVAKLLRVVRGRMRVLIIPLFMTVISFASSTVGISEEALPFIPIL